MQGSGPHGRVVEKDVRAAIAGGAREAGRGAAAAPAAAKPPAAAAAAGAERFGRRRSKPSSSPAPTRRSPHDGMRKTIAQRLAESKQTVPHFYLTIDCELDALLALREQINAAAPKDKDGKPAYKVSVNDFVIKALAIALQRVPDANVRLDRGQRC